MVRSYTLFANNGSYVDPVYILRIEDSDGNVLRFRSIQPARPSNECRDNSSRHGKTSHSRDNRSSAAVWQSAGLLFVQVAGFSAVADGLLYQFPDWDTAVAIQHEDPKNPDKTIWSFYGDMAPAFDQANSYIEPKWNKADGLPIKQGDLIGYQGRWLGPSQQTWVHLRFALLPAVEAGGFPDAFLAINDFSADLPGMEEQQRLGLDGPVSLTAYTGLPESKFFGILDFLPFICKSVGE